MAGSRRSPVLRDQWSAGDQRDPRDPRDRDRRRGRGSNRARGQNHRGRGRPYRPNDRHFDRGRSPTPAHASRFGPDSSHDLGDFPVNRSPRHGSPGLPTSGLQNDRRPSLRQPPSAADDSWNTHRFGPPPDRDTFGPQRDESPFPPPSKRKRTRSPSPRGHRPSVPRHHHAKHGERRDRSPPYQKRGGRFQGRGGGRGRSPQRRRDRRRKDDHRPAIPRSGPSRSPVRDRRWSRSPSANDHSDNHSRYRSPSRHSVQSERSRSIASRSSRGDPEMGSTRPIQSVVDDSARPPSPPRPIPSFDADSDRGPGSGPADLRDTYPMHGVRASDVPHKQRRRSSHPHVDTGPYATSPQYATPSSSYHGSPQPGSPYSGRAGWGGQHPYPGQSGHGSPYHQNGPPGQYYQNYQGSYNGPSNHHPQSYGPPSYRGGHGGYRGNYSNQGQDRRFSGSGPHHYNNGPSQRGGRGNFNNQQWSASGSRGRGGQHSPHHMHSHGSQTPPSHDTFVNDSRSPRAGEPQPRSRRPSNDDLQREDDYPKPVSESGDTQQMPPPGPESELSTPVKAGGKFSFAFKSKAAPAPSPKPVPDLAQRMQVRDPPPRAPEPTPPRNRLTNGPLPTFKPDNNRFDRRDRGGRDRGRDRREFRDSRDFNPRDRRDDRRFDQRRDKRKGDRRPDFRQDFPERQDRPNRQDHRRELSIDAPKEPLPKPKKILTRPKPRPILSEEFAQADSVYYRKPGNESVIGAGTYGKVFKAIHVYTKRQVALKKIRMEGEKDGFPVTAVREIKLLQHLRNENVVSLLEVMVEKNECFMVFEYLSHDLTGLINHPTFSLTLAHKKDLAKQMFEGLNYLHHRGVLHRDIKAANILISNRGLLKYADFGLARFFSKTRQLHYTNRVITIWYRPPELLLGETRYGPAVDVWSAACVCMEMFTKKAVFPGEGSELSQMDKLYNLLGTPTRAEWQDVVEMPWFQLMRPTERKKRTFEETFREVLTPDALDLISQVFQYDPVKRPSAEGVLKHPYFVSEEPAPQPPIELENIEGDWHEFESKALRKEARRVEHQNQKDREKRKAEAAAPLSDRDPKRVRQDESSHRTGSSAPS